MSQSDQVLNIILMYLLGFIFLFGIGAVIYGQIKRHWKKGNRQLSPAKELF